MQTRAASYPARVPVGWFRLKGTDHRNEGKPLGQTNHMGISERRLVLQQEIFSRHQGFQVIAHESASFPLIEDAVAMGAR